MQAYSPALVAAVATYFDRRNYRYTLDSGLLDARFNLRGKVGSYRQRIVFHQDDFQVYSILNVNADEACRSALCDYLARVNSVCNFGNLEMDLSDGELRTRVSVHCHNRAPDDELIGDALNAGDTLLERFGDGLPAFLFGMATPEAAFAAAEDG